MHVVRSVGLAALAAGALVSTVLFAPAGAVFQPPAGAGAALLPDPPKNIDFPTPFICRVQPLGVPCEQAAVYDLDVARHDMGLGPYRLPAGFLSQSALEQSFILTNLDRTAYDVRPAQGVNRVLDGWAQATIASATDPEPEGTRVDGQMWRGFASNAASGYPNLLFAYGAWVYADGPGGDNGDCTPTNHSGCWGHRHNVLATYPEVPSFGAASGSDSLGAAAWDQDFVGTASALPYRYTWAQAEQQGAGTNDYRVPSTTALRRSVVGNEATYTVTVAPAPVTAAKVHFHGAAAACGKKPVNHSTGKATCQLPTSSTKAWAVFVGNQYLLPSRSKGVG